MLFFNATDSFAFVQVHNNGTGVQFGSAFITVLASECIQAKFIRHGWEKHKDHPSQK